MLLYDLYRKRAGNGNFYIGLFLLLLSFAMLIFGKFSAIYYVANLGYIVAILGVSIALFGVDAAFRHAISWLVMLVIVPMPQFIMIQLYAYLSKLVTYLGKACGLAFGFSLFVDANWVDFGTVQLNALDINDAISFLFLSFVVSLILSSRFVEKKPLRLLLFLSGPAALIALCVLRFLGALWAINSGIKFAAYQQLTGGYKFLAGYAACQLLMLFCIRKADSVRQFDISAFVCGFRK